MQNIDILLVEDNEPDVVLVREALKEAKVYNQLHVTHDGEAALAFLHGDPVVNPDNVTPGLILLDLYMPKLNGMEVLKEIKDDPRLKVIPVVMMTSSTDEADIVKAYDLQASAYVIKPIDFHQLTAVVRSIEQFWLSVVQLPALKPDDRA